MSFRCTQLGRFGEYGNTLCTNNDPDQRAAHLYAINGVLTTAHRPDIGHVLASKGLWAEGEDVWLKWQSMFQILFKRHQSRGGRLLQATCTESRIGVPNGECWHELTPPLKHDNLRNFANTTLPSLRNSNIITLVGGAREVDEHIEPVWNFVVTQEGEILVGAEDYKLIKHTCLSAGRDVWSAGQIGIEHKKICIVDLKSGHYVKTSTLPVLKKLLSDFTREVSVHYSKMLGVQCLDANFECTEN